MCARELRSGSPRVVATAGLVCRRVQLAHDHRRGLARVRLDRRRLLVHCFHLLREPRDHARPLTHGHASPASGPPTHRGSSRRSSPAPWSARCCCACSRNGRSPHDRRHRDSPTGSIASAIAWATDACAAAALDAELSDADPIVVETHPHLFAESRCSWREQHAREMQRVISAVECGRSPAGLSRAGAGTRARHCAALRRANRGVFFGFDFHIAADGPKLIEINTNAGGALLNIEMQRAQQACCDAGRRISFAWSRRPSHVRRRIVDMFMHEWRLARGASRSERSPSSTTRRGEQYLFPEFLLFKTLFEAHGIRALIVDARELTVDADSLTHRRATHRSRLQPLHGFLLRGARTRGARGSVSRAISR